MAVRFLDRKKKNKKKKHLNDGIFEGLKNVGVRIATGSCLLAVPYPRTHERTVLMIYPSVAQTAADSLRLIRRTPMCR